LTKDNGARRALISRAFKGCPLAVVLAERGFSYV
jgi:hypothetical protein